MSQQQESFGGKRKASNGGGASSLGYLFGNSAEPVPETQHARVAMPERKMSPLKEHDINAVDNDAILRNMLIKDLRGELRAQGLNPAGSKDTLVERLQEHMANTGSPYKSDFMIAKTNAYEQRSSSVNNYQRPEGQNVGNFLTDRNSSKVLAPPGGSSSFTLG